MCQLKTKPSAYADGKENNPISHYILMQILNQVQKSKPLTRIICGSKESIYFNVCIFEGFKKFALEKIYLYTC